MDLEKGVELAKELKEKVQGLALLIKRKDLAKVQVQGEENEEEDVKDTVEQRKEEEVEEQKEE